MSITPTMEQMAIAVLRGDEAAARALADEVVGVCQEGGVALPPVHRLNVDVGRVRAVLHVNPSAMGGWTPSEDNINEMAAGVSDWLAGRRDALFLPAGIALSLYEMPVADIPISIGGTGFSIPGVTSTSGSLDVPFTSTPWPEPVICARCGNEPEIGTAWAHDTDAGGRIILCDYCHQQVQKESAD